MTRRNNRLDMGISRVAILIAVLLSTATAADVDRSTLNGKVICGYQGWFATPGDGLGRGWYHWSMNPNDFRPGSCKIDLWPDVSELDADERYATPFKRSDGRAAEVYSAQNA